MIVSRDRASAVQVDRKLAHPDECGFDARLSGTTACLALVAGDQVATANVGDSRAMIVRSAPGNRLQAVQLTQDAKPELPGVRALTLTLMLVRSAPGNRCRRCSCRRTPSRSCRGCAP